MAQKRVRISHGKQVIGVRAIAVRLYIVHKDFTFIYLFILFFIFLKKGHNSAIRRAGKEKKKYRSANFP